MSPTVESIYLAKAAVWCHLRSGMFYSLQFGIAKHACHICVLYAQSWRDVTVKLKAAVAADNGCFPAG
jgi:hypothetical protein